MNTGNNIEKWVKGYQVPSEKNKEDAWKELRAKLPTSNDKEIHPFYFKRWGYLAASVLVVAVLFTFIFDSVYGTLRYFTEGGQQQTIVLPDSTKIKLNPSSELTVNYSVITGKRKLRLNGEALFEVTPGKQFTVKFGWGKVSVLGTRFTISAYENMSPAVNCLSGKVKVTTEKKEALLGAGKGIEIRKGEKPVVTNVQKQKVIDEINGQYSWTNVPLQTVFKTIENYSGYKISATNEIKSRKFSGHADLNDLAETCGILSFAMDLSFKSNEQSKTIVFESSN